MRGNRGKVVLLLLGGILAAGLIFALGPDRAERMRLEITGTPGTTVNGTYEVDGKLHQLNGLVPLEIEVKARSVQYAFHKGEEDGDIGGRLVRLDADPGAQGSSVSATSSGPLKGVRGGIWKRNRILPRSAFASTYTSPPPASMPVAK
jgi:hypothetical protein